MKKKASIVICIFVVIVCYSFYIISNKKNLNEVILDNKENSKENIGNNNLAIMVEGDNGYERWNQNTWPTDGYEFNKKLSKCKNGNTISFDNNQIIVKGINADICYVYFDKVTAYHALCDDNTLACEVAKQYKDNVVEGDGGIYYHNSELTAGAQDESYRYAGNNPDNFVCFGEGAENYYLGNGTCPVENLYRIIGLFKNSEGQYEVKLIKSEYITEQELRGSTTEGKWGDADENDSKLIPYTNSKIEYQPRIQNTSEINGFFWNSAQYEFWVGPTSHKYNLWEYNKDDENKQKATLNAALNDDVNGYLKTIGNDWGKKIVNTTWHIGGSTKTTLTPKQMYDAEMYTEGIGMKYKAPQITSQAKIGLMYASDYGYAAANINDLWTKDLDGSANLGYYSDDNRRNNWMYNGICEYTITRETENSDGAFNIVNVGELRVANSESNACGVRPVFYLDASTKVKLGENTDGSFAKPYKIEYAS